MAKTSPDRLVIATRASRLAVWQANHVRELLLQLYPNCDVQLLELTTKGDRILDRTLSKVGGKGLFIKELEAALLDGRADLAVHSLKDVPVELTHSFALPIILERDDPRDALVCPNYTELADLPAGAVVGTSSLRRESQIRARYPHLQVRPLRGNLDTRLAKLDAGEYDAIILAAVGLKRLNLQARVANYLSVDDCLPSAGQGALGIEILAERSELNQWLQPLNCRTSQFRSLAERAVSRGLGGSCQVPLAAYAQVENSSQITVRGLVAEPDGSRVLRAERHGNLQSAESLGEQVAQELLEAGADKILARLLGPDAATSN
ncbi:MAG TPA: hydroxymethylbilane synthase [Burkholderiaceae bacterium]|nr:hydroxymethylbilane synthase [Burkholderiaceae bacterium]